MRLNFQTNSFMVVVLPAIPFEGWGVEELRWLKLGDVLRFYYVCLLRACI